MTARTEELVRKREDFEKGIRDWMDLEELTIGSCAGIIEKTESPIVRAMIKAIEMDSRKHKELLALVIQCLEGTVTMTPDELGAVSHLLDRHASFERRAIEHAENAIQESRHFVITQILKYILEDERKHFSMATDLNAYKAHIYPYA